MTLAWISCPPIYSSHTWRDESSVFSRAHVAARCYSRPWLLCGHLVWCVHISLNKLHFQSLQRGDRWRQIKLDRKRPFSWMCYESLRRLPVSYHSVGCSHPKDQLWGCSAHPSRNFDSIMTKHFKLPLQLCAIKRRHENHIWFLPDQLMSMLHF